MKSQDKKTERHDEEKMIETLTTHLELKKLVIEIAKKANIKVEDTKNNDPKGDFVYCKKDKEKLIKVLDKFLYEKKVKKENV